MGRQEVETDAVVDIAGGTCASPRRTRSRATRLLLLGASALALMLALASVAGAAEARWELLTNHSPTNVPKTAAIPQVWKISESESPNSGRFRVLVTFNEKSGKSALLPYDASAAELKAALEATHVAGKALGAVFTVTGGPAKAHEAAWTYVITITGALEGLAFSEFEAESVEATGAEKKEVEKAGEEVEEASPETAEVTYPYRNTVNYVVIPTNVGSVAATGTLTIVDKLPPGLVTEETPESLGGAWKCLPEGEGHTEVECKSTTAVNPDSQGEVIFIRAYANPSTIKLGEKLVDEATISGGGPASSKTTDEALVSETAAGYGVHDFKAEAFGPNGEEYTVAGGHPYAATTHFFFNSRNKFSPWAIEEPQIEPLVYGNLKDADVLLPEGFVGNPAGGRLRCTQAEFTLGARGEPGENPHSGCAPNSQVGTVDLFVNQFTFKPNVVPVYNLIPPAGVPAEFGFVFENTPVRLDAHVRYINGHYRVTVLSPDINEAFNISGLSLTLWGVPADKSHNAERNAVNHNERGAENTETPVRPFLSNPTSCVQQAETAPETVLSYDQWELPGSLDTEGNPVTEGGYPLVEGGNWHVANYAAHAVTGCKNLKFEPKVTFKQQPESEGGSTQVAAPSGAEFELEVPQNEEPSGLATPELKDTTVTLPQGVTLSPAAANGLEACSEAQIALKSLARGSCPEASLVGHVVIHSSLLEEPVLGRVYIGQPECSPCHEADDESGKIFKLFIEAEAAHAGVRIKLPGTAVTGTAETEKQPGGLKNGQIRTTFLDNPQLPFTTLQLTLKGGPRATLANPATCGTFTTETILTPWSAFGSFETGGKVVSVEGDEPAKASSTGITTSYDGAGASCPASLTFGPSFAMLTENQTAGAYSPLITVIKRGDDREQDLKGVSITTPPGLLGKIAGVARCEVAPAQLEKEEAQCPENSRIGTATTAAGSGTSPYVVSGPVYLTGRTTSSNGELSGPFGLDIAVPAKAGPFNLGTVVVQSVITINPETSALTITSNPLPQSIDGIPFRIKQVEVKVDRPEFTFNPTNCETKEIKGAFSGEPAGQPGEVSGTNSPSYPFTASNCGALPFNPTFSASTKAQYSKNEGDSLTVKVGQVGGEAHIHKVEIQLPENLPSRQSTLKLACTSAQFNKEPAGCPKEAFVGEAVATTPLLNEPLRGKGILVARGAEFPDLVFLLEGENGIKITLTGHTAIHNGITYSRFETVPDAPVSSFETVLPKGKFSILGVPVGVNLCAKPLIAPTTITGQNNKQIRQLTRIAVEGCPPVVRILSTRATRTSLIVTVNVSQPGTVEISGRGLRTTIKRGVSAGTHVITVPLSSYGRSQARKHRTIGVRASDTAAGQSGSTTTTAKA